VDKLIVEKIRVLIQQKIVELASEDDLGHGGLRTVELDQQSVGRLSRMDALQSQAMAQAQQRRRDSQKNALSAALRRIDESEFGYCEDCGDVIAEARLKANPAMMRCISCARG
jgi:DnaK suppressor protein